MTHPKTNTKYIKLSISGDNDAVNATLVFDRPEVYRSSSSPQFHQWQRLEQCREKTRRPLLCPSRIPCD